jgi:Zn-dependent protease
MNFRLFGIDVEIEASFWLSNIIFGWTLVDKSRGVAGLLPLAIWSLIVLVSILIHEYGHALAIRRHRIQPEITLYWMGGKTTWRELLPIRRIDHIIISLAGPLAGFAFGGLIYAFTRFFPGAIANLPYLGHWTIGQLLFVNIGWGFFNLIPVLPLDGGHVLEHALGPKRIRITAGISMVVGFVAAIYFWQRGMWWATYLMGMGAFQSLRILQAGGIDIDESDLRPRTPVAEAEPMISGEILSLLHRARQAVAADDFAKARSICNQLLNREPDADNAAPPNAKREAFEILAWAALGSDDVDDASAKLEAAKKLGEVDAALVGAVHFAKREMAQARRVLEAARARGDDRKEIVGPLIQILIEQGEVARAAAIAYDIVDSLSEDDARKMAQLAFDNSAFDWSARLYETAFERQGHAEDAYEAARAHAQDGAYDRASDMLRKAVAAGFNDRTRAWSDSALEALRARDGLDAVLPRP